VFAANLLTGELVQVASTTGLGYPSYTGDDAAVVFTDADAGTESQVSLDTQPLALDRLTPSGARTRWLTDGGVGVIYRRGSFDGALQNPGDCALACGDVNVSGVLDEGDVTVFRSFLADPTGSPLSPEAAGRCNVIGAPGPCTVLDVVVMRRALATPPLSPGIAPVCTG
jgi:hypothetical protein